MSCKKYKYFLFDLDGTLTDPFLGITNSVAYSLKHYGINVEDRKELACFIGPPLYESYEKYYGFSHEGAVEAVEKYREYYRDKGIFENRLYDGIAHMLKTLKKSGKTVIMATSKPTVFARRIAEHYGIMEYFDVLVGSELDGKRVDKAEVIEEALRQAGFPERSECIMVGDRLHDIIGAKKNSLTSIGVLYGYGSREELSEAGADLMVETVDELLEVLNK